jgi:hypothetical protein
VNLPHRTMRDGGKRGKSYAGRGNFSISIFITFSRKLLRWIVAMSSKHQEDWKMHSRRLCLVVSVVAIEQPIHSPSTGANDIAFK